MDDRTFDEAAAREWIDTIEGSPTSPRDQDIYPRLNAWLARTQPRSVLEIGAGQGICSDKIDLANRDYTGVEPSPYLLARANERSASTNRRFVDGNAYALPFADATFDAVFSVAVWHLLSDIEGAARELRRVLKPGGAFLIITANPAAYRFWADRYSEKRIDGNRLEGRTSSSVDVLYLHPLDELMRSLGARTTDTFRTVNNHDMFIAIEG